MIQYQAGSIRNVCLLSHGGVGKTSLLEAACFTAHATTKMGHVANGSSLFDTRPIEKERKMTISMHLGHCAWHDNKMNFLDTPGFLDFLGDARSALRVVETAVVLIDAVDGVQVGTEIIATFIDDVKAAKLFFVNGIDKDNADFDKSVAAIKKEFGSGAAPVIIPIDAGSSCSGVIDLVSKEAFAYTCDGDGIGRKTTIPDSMIASVDTYRQALMESVAETDEKLMNSYFENGELSDTELRAGLAVAVVSGAVYPILTGSALHNVGVDQLLTKIVNLCPSAATRVTEPAFSDEQMFEIPCTASAPTTAFVFKTISEEHLGEINLVRVFSGKLTTSADMLNVTKQSHERIGNMYYLCGKERHDTSEIVTGDIGGLLKMKETHTNDTLVDKHTNHRIAATQLPDPLVSVAIMAKAKGDEDKVSVGFAKLHEEDVSFTYNYHADIHQSILSAMGEIQIDVLLESLKQRFKVEVEKVQPKISYRETITKSVQNVEYTHKKQSGGAGQYARVFIDMEPLPRGENYAFVDKIVGGAIDQSMRPSVDKGIHSKLTEGVIAGYPIVDVRVTLVDGKMHPVDSKDIAFQIAGREVFKKAFEMSSPILLEPVVELKISIPEEYTGDIMGDMSARRGKIGGMNLAGKYQQITAKVPETEVMTYATTLRSLTQGRGFYTKRFSHYDPVPAELAKKVIEAYVHEPESH